jgi:hypothetical protein
VRCWLCPRSISAADAPKRVEWREQTVCASEDGGTVQIHRSRLVLYGQDNESLSIAHGRLIKAAHGKCYHAWRKRVPIGRGSQEEHNAHEDHGNS